MVPAELEKRYDKAVTLLRRIVKAEAKLHWQEGETYEEVILSIRHFLADLKLEADIGALIEAESRTTT